MTKNKSLKIVGILVTAAGFGITMLNEWLNDKKEDEKIDEKIEKALAERNL